MKRKSPLCYVAVAAILLVAGDYPYRGRYLVSLLDLTWGLDISIQIYYVHPGTVAAVPLGVWGGRLGSGRMYSPYGTWWQGFETIGKKMEDLIKSDDKLWDLVLVSDAEIQRLRKQADDALYSPWLRQADDPRDIPWECPSGIGGVQYDDEGWMTTNQKYRRCLEFINIRDEGRYYLGFSDYSELPPSAMEIARLLLTSVVDKIIAESEYKPDKRRPRDMYSQAAAEAAYCRDTFRDPSIWELAAGIRRDYEETTKAGPYEEFREHYWKEWVENCQGRIRHHEFLERHKMPAERRKAMIAHLKWQETRCARMLLEGKADDAKQDFECRSIQIRDYLQYGPKGAPEEVLVERASRPLAPSPPKLPWESNQQEARSKAQDAGGAAGGSPVDPKDAHRQGADSPADGSRSGATALAGALALLAALLLRKANT